MSQVPTVPTAEQEHAPRPRSRIGSKVGRAIGDPVALALVKPPKDRGRVLVAICAGWLITITLVAVFADLLPLAPYDAPVGSARQSPGFRWPEPLGTDSIGRSQLSRVIYGARVSLAIGVASVLLGLLVGGLVGLASGYLRGRFERFANIVLDSMLAFPPLVMLLALTSVLTPSLPTLVLALAVLSVPSFARLSRANTLTVAQRNFILATRSLGARRKRIVFGEVLPNVIFPVSSYAFIIVATVIVAEGSLSFLGLGIPPPQPSWGGMISFGRTYMAESPHLVIVPAIFLVVTVFAFNLVGDRVRRRFDVRESALG